MAAATLALAVAALLAWVPWARGDFELRSRRLGGVTYVDLGDVARYYGMSVRRADEAFTLTSRSRQLELNLDKRAARINGTSLDLAFAPVLAGDGPWLAEPDLRLHLDPIFRGWSLPPGRPRRVMLDPGHGGKDQGARGSRHLEKDLVLRLALLAEAELRTAGYEVKLTRRDDRFIELADRPAAARAWDADLFVSIHFNSAGNASVNGIETWVLAQVGTPGSYDREPITEAQPANRFDARNARLAFEVQRALVQASGAADRGVRRSRFRVLRDPPCPAVLIEGGFLSNAAEERHAGDPGYQRRLARGIASGVAAYTRVVERR